MAESVTPTPHLGIERIYLRDLSFESPRAPAIFAKQWKPAINIDINMKSSRLDHARHEVVLTITVTAKMDDVTSLLVELQQAGIFRLDDMDEEMTQHVLSVTCPGILFPYARETIDSLVVKGTFPPLMVAPVSFDALYAQAKRQQQANKETNA